MRKLDKFSKISMKMNMNIDKTEDEMMISLSTMTATATKTKVEKSGNTKMFTTTMTKKAKRTENLTM